MVCNRSRASSTRTRPTSTHIGWRVKENFPETFKSQLEKNKDVIHRPRSVRIGRNCALDLSIALGLRPRVGLKTSRAQFLPIRTSQPVAGITYIYLNMRNCLFIYSLQWHLHYQQRHHLQVWKHKLVLQTQYYTLPIKEIKSSWLSLV